MIISALRDMTRYFVILTYDDMHIFEKGGLTIFVISSIKPTCLFIDDSIR